LRAVTSAIHKNYSCEMKDLPGVRAKSLYSADGICSEESPKGANAATRSVNKSDG